MKWLWCAPIFLALTASPAGPQQANGSNADVTLRSVLREYAAKNHQRAIASLLTIPSARLTEEIKELERSDERLQRFTDREAAAIMLVDAAASVQWQSAQSLPLWRLGIRVGGDLIAAGDVSPALRTWWLLADAVGEDIRDLGALEPLLTNLRKALRDDAEVLFVSGSLYETIAAAKTLALPAGPDVSTAPTSSRRTSAGFSPAFGQRGNDRDRPGHLKLARDFYRAALTVSPSHVEARLRLARVLHQLGDLSGALAALDAVRADALPQELLYLSRLFRADIEEDLGHADQSRAAYLSAMEWRAQAPTVGLAALLRSEGDAAAALALTQRLLADSPDFDPWWSYQRGQGWHLTERLAAARAAVR